MAATVADKIKGLAYNPNSVLVLNGKNITLKNVNIDDGTLVVNAVPGASVRVENLTVRSPKGWEFVPLTPAELADEKTLPIFKMRGYKLVKGVDAKVYNITEPGEYVIGADGQLRQVAAAAAPVSRVRGMAESFTPKIRSATRATASCNAWA